MATLFNTKIKDTYQSLLKLEDNTILTTTVKNVTDGLGNASPLYMSTTQVRIGSTAGSAMYWDNVNNRLGIGTSSPTQALSVNGTITANGLSFSGALQGTGTGDNYLKGSAFTIQSAVNNTDNSFYISTASLLERKVLFLAKNLGSYGRSDLYLCINGDSTATNASITDSKVLFKANGNVLIGTTTDAGYKLDVNGTVRTGNLTIGAMLIGDVGGSRVFNTAGLAIDYGAFYPFSITGTSTASITPAGILTLKGVTHNYTATETYTVQKTTNIGHLQINFDIVGSDATSFNYGTRSGNVRIYPGEQSNGNGYGNVILGHSGTAARGNVGIGTSSPTSKLYLDGGLFTKKYYTDTSSQTINFGSAYELFGTPHASSGYSFFINPDGFSSGWDVNIGNATTYFNFSNGAGFSAFNVNAAALSLGGGQLSYYLSSPNTGWSYASAFGWNFVIRGSADEKLRITSGGNVLIGTTTDAGYKLDVNGTARVNGVLTVGNSTITGNFGAMTLSNNGVAGVALSFTNSSFGSNNPCILGTQGLSAHSSSQLEIKSTTKGFLPPRMTSTQRNAIATPATGLQVFDTTQNAICEYTGTAWRTVSGGKQVINAITGATTLDLSLGNVADVTLTLSTVLTLNNPTVGTYVIKLIQDAIGGKTVSWPFNVLWSGSTPPTLTATANRTDVITLLYDGVNFYGTYALNF